MEASGVASTAASNDDIEPSAPGPASSPGDAAPPEWPQARRAIPPPSETARAPAQTETSRAEVPVMEQSYSVASSYSGSFAARRTPRTM